MNPDPLDSIDWDAEPIRRARRSRLASWSLILAASLFWVVVLLVASAILRG